MKKEAIYFMTFKSDVNEGCVMEHIKKGASLAGLLEWCKAKVPEMENKHNCNITITDIKYIKP